MLRRSLRTLSTALTLAALSPTPWAVALFAADEPAAPRQEHAALFKSLDKDGNGSVELSEVPEDQRRLLERLIGNHDKNKDGKLTVDELSAGLNEQRARGETPRGEAGPGRPGGGQFSGEEIFKRLDADGDGKVKPDDVPEERREGFRRMLERVDENKDGAASLEEFRKGFAAAQGARPEQGNPEGRRPQPGQPGGPQPFGDALLFRSVDTDGNGTLSKEELAKAGEALAKLDKNADGSVSREEILPPRGEGFRPGQPQAGQPDRPNPSQMLGYMMRQDANGDGAISKEEAGDRLRENFDRIDGNGDGKLTEPELKQMIEKMAAAGLAPGRRPEGAPNPNPARRPEERKPEGDRRPDGERKPDARRPEGDKPAGDRRPEGDRKPEPDRRPDVKPDAPKPDARRPEGDRKPDAERRPDAKPDAKQSDVRRSEDKKPEGERRPDAKKPDAPKPDVKEEKKDDGAPKKE